ncbi:MAG: hypothetical protein A2186_02175 [Candidatus Levybacteria bacterium RIFOXYA1_FULL_41_10]|nr:MAG: hypothetical protein A3D82_04380 [Candidatus Levybacteria bacterium RIFCSPHIGHO2_02_FULL_40_29]OGH49975.1 MAG: hypothetical protein A3J18_03670 [Candidatus Levybacteria bacterium RIFCSPLOWO2_02_FULL_40_18]OGH52828.1 MAG: hypothetical protein A2423_02135 [Candidatus Levybacteria bacterium RIFOXYC1_FULL_40_10]OGH54423.1 MAG: hypothetical protein A2596_02870 [Candidatus Levybacteria bacterium RIFOXYD1_FULL_40_21]OGH57343.1 MAG: hypothetical protein A2186_02175 [Candidatus Levybacteria bact
MKIDGRLIAENILEGLKSRVEVLRKKGVIPTFLVILVGDNENSIAYIKQKEIKATEIGARVEVVTLSEKTSFEEAKELILKLNDDPLIHGIIIQRPAPKSLRVDRLSDEIWPEKEIDGFGNDALYDVPVAEAVILIIQTAFEQMGKSENFKDWIEKQKIVVIGKGETAGGPIIAHMQKMGLNPQVVDNKTQNPKKISKQADILVSAVGKNRTVTADMVKRGVILIGVGLHTDGEGKLRGDFHRDEIAEIVSFYSPTPGGVGPVNVACLIGNLVEACEKQSSL